MPNVLPDQGVSLRPPPDTSLQETTSTATHGENQVSTLSRFALRNVGRDVLRPHEQQPSRGGGEALEEVPSLFFLLSE